MLIATYTTRQKLCVSPPVAIATLTLHGVVTTCHQVGILLALAPGHTVALLEDPCDRIAS